MDIWKTMLTNDFNRDKYLYHYTKIDSAIKIICSNKLLFSPLTRANDTSETKMKLDFSPSPNVTEEEFTKQTETIKNYFTTNKRLVKILCFSTDSRMSNLEREKAMEKVSPKTKYYDISGRGFALPRMWAQYADDNAGVCFIFDKELLLKQVEKRVAFYKAGPVSYRKFFNRYLVTAEHMEGLNQKIDMVGNGTLTLLKLVQDDHAFLQYNFFEKLDDWKNEHEFRIVTLTDKEDSTIFVDELSTFLRGVVLGERIDLTYARVFEILLKDANIACDVKRISFDSNCCLVKS